MTSNSNYTVDPIVAATLQIICAMLKRYQNMNYNIYIYIEGDCHPATNRDL